MMKTKGKGKGKGGKKCAIALGCATFVVAGCKTVPATDPDTGEVIPGAPPVVEPDPDAISATAIAIGTALGGPVGGMIAALGGAGVFGTAAYVVNQRRKRKEEEEWEVVGEADEGS